MHDPNEVVDFWREAGPKEWFAHDPAFDARFRARFEALHFSAARGELQAWRQSAAGSLALLILLDQFPRNAFRGSGHMYATDGLARALARAALAAGHDQQVEPALRLFCYLPFSHSEDLADQALAVQLQTRLGAEAEGHARGHHDIVQRFGRFPHRNPLLGRTTTAEETAFLRAGGFKG
jgi:uncharacterized protein (DUF924 family)